MRRRWRLSRRRRRRGRGKINKRRRS